MTKLGYGLDARAPVGTVMAIAQAAEQGGYETFWLNHPHEHDGLAALATAARITSRIMLGTGVVPLSHRNVESIRAGLSTSNLPPSRYRLGVGSGTGPLPLERMREALAALRSWAKCQLVVAALGPRMCDLAGAEADAVLLNWLTPQYASRCAKLVFQAAERMNRPRPEIYAYVRVSLGEASIARLHREAAFYEAIPHQRANFQRMGADAVATAVSARSPEEVAPALRLWDGIVDEVVVRALPANDRIDEAVAILDAARPAFL